MDESKLLSLLSSMNALRTNRERVGELILSDKTHFKLLFSLVFKANNNIAIKAAWVLEIVCEYDLQLIYPYLDEFTKKISLVTQESAIRPLVKICKTLLMHNQKIRILPFNDLHKERLIEACFDWLISDHKVATKAYSMTCLFILGKTNDWIHPELKIIIVDNMDTESAAYKARGKMTLLGIKKFSTTKK